MLKVGPRASQVSQVLGCLQMACPRSDPNPSVELWADNDRGVSFTFGRLGV